MPRREKTVGGIKEDLYPKQMMPIRVLGRWLIC